MSGSHGHVLHYHGHSVVHRLPSAVKLVALFVFVMAVVTTPREAWWAFLVHLGVVIAVIVTAGLPAGFVVRRALVVVPFLATALLLPFLGPEPNVAVGPLTLSVEGLWGMWNIFAKAGMGVLASIVLAGTTEVPDIFRGMDRLRVPPVFTAIAGFMVRYLDTIGGEVQRTRTAMELRGQRSRWLGNTAALASIGGTLFVRAYERGERIHQSMVVRGFEGVMPTHREEVITARHLMTAALPTLLAVMTTILAWLITSSG